MLHIQTQQGTHAIQARIANRFWPRFKGLMLTASLPEQGGLLITTCNSVHTAFMRYPIDIVYLDQHGQVQKCVARLRPWRASFGWLKTIKHTLELPAGSITRYGIQAGDRVCAPGLPGPMA